MECIPSSGRWRSRWTVRRDLMELGERGYLRRDRSRAWAVTSAGNALLGRDAVVPRWGWRKRPVPGNGKIRARLDTLAVLEIAD